MDNATRLAAEEGQDERAAYASAIREAGWEQIPSADGSWPPGDQTITIRLSRDQWLFVLAQSRESARLYIELDDEESANLSRRAIAAVESGLD